MPLRPTPLSLAHYGSTHVGMKRSQNQDAFLSVPEHGLFVVADGMGGHKGGEIASKTAVTTICDEIRSQAKSGAEIHPPELLRSALREANQRIRELAQKSSDLQGMGTTVTAILIDEERAYIAQVGDSRCYLHQPHKCWQLTKDHSLVQEKLRAGLITREQLKTDKTKNVITRSVGYETQVDVDIYQMAVRPGDVFLLCSDGLTGLVEDTAINGIITKLVFQDSRGKLTQRLQTAAQDLCHQANRNGGDDNVTALLIGVMEGASGP